MSIITACHFPWLDPATDADWDALVARLRALEDRLRVPVEAIVPDMDEATRLREALWAVVIRLIADCNLSRTADDYRIAYRLADTLEWRLT